MAEERHAIHRRNSTAAAMEEPDGSTITRALADCRIQEASTVANACRTAAENEPDSNGLQSFTTAAESKEHAASAIAVFAAAEP